MNASPPLKLRSRSLLPAAILLVVACLACAPKTHVSVELVNEYAASRTLGQLEPGWTLRHVGRDLDSARRIVHRVEVGPERAGEILMMSGRERNQLVGRIACPGSDDPIWEKLTASQDIVVDLRTEKGSFESISCRSAVL